MFLLFILPCVFADNLTLQHVSILFRHGERTPSSTYPNDPYKDYPWSGGWDQLTMRGMKEAYDLGVRIKDEYKDFLTDYYLPDEVYVLSSYAERCHMTAQLLLTGLFPPVKEQKWTSELPWQPVPIHSSPRNLDNLIAMKMPCAAYDKAYKELYKSDKIREIDQENSDLYEYLTENTGSNVTSVLQVERLYNTLQIEEINNLTLPEWTVSVYPEKMKPIAALTLALFTDNDLMKRLKGGVFVKKVISDMEEKIEDSKNKRKLILYSGHDLTLVNVLRTLGEDDLIKPHFVAHLILELYKTNSTNYVRVFYRNDLYDKGRELKVKGCEIPCKFAEFKKAMEAVTPSDWEKECGLNS